jgi:RimJ/RimL family protein N-acetyltransferase
MNNLTFRKAVIADAKIYFDWATEKDVRKYSFNSSDIHWEDHKRWFNEKIADSRFCFFIFQNLNQDLIGQVRLEWLNNREVLIGISVSAEFRGFGYGLEMIEKSRHFILTNYKDVIIHAYIKKENRSSIALFEKAGFELKEKTKYENINSYHYIICK